MKVIIEKQTNKLGDEFLNEEEVTANIELSSRSITMEVDNVLYIIPMAVIKGLESVRG